MLKMTKKIQYGILFALYLSRAGRATVAYTAQNLSLSEGFLTQVAHVLRKKGVVASIRGPNGGYELVGCPTVNDVIAALQSPAKSRSKAYSTSLEHRALHNFYTGVVRSLNAECGKSVQEVVEHTSKIETRYLDNITGSIV